MKNTDIEALTIRQAVPADIPALEEVIRASVLELQGSDYTPEQRSCIAQHYASYDAKQINQCVDVCRACMKGNVVTCNTSCRLRGAS